MPQLFISRLRVDPFLSGDDLVPLSPDLVIGPTLSYSSPCESLAVSAGQSERRADHPVHQERAGEQLLCGL